MAILHEAKKLKPRKNACILSPWILFSTTCSLAEKENDYLSVLVAFCFWDNRQDSITSGVVYIPHIKDLKVTFYTPDNYINITA